MSRIRPIIAGKNRRFTRQPLAEYRMAKVDDLVDRCSAEPNVIGQIIHEVLEP